jgi:hypothetical protein
MKLSLLAVGSAAALAAVLLVHPVLAQNPSPAASSPSEMAASSPAGSPNDAEMMKQMMELAKLNENHKLLSSLDGTWSYTVKMWMSGDTSTKPDESKGTMTRKSIMGGRYAVMDVKGKMEMPGEDGKPKEMTFLGHGTEGYDNVKKKFVGTWYDNMGTGIMMTEGTYDEASKTFTFSGQYEAMPGMVMKIREVVKLTDEDHMTMEWFEDRGGKEVKTMQIDYARK